MPAKIRLQRRGKKGRPFYHIVIADGRAPRDGRSIEKIGTYDPMTNPATVELNFDKALHWLQVGAQPTDTTKAILSYEGVMYKHHLLKGVKKGAFNEEKAEVLFKEWREAKDAKILAKASGLSETSRNEDKKRFEAEVKVNEDRKAEFSKLKAEAQAVIEAAAKAKADERAEAEAKVEAEAKAKTAEALKVEAPKAEAKKEEAPKEEATPEAKVEAPKEEAAPEAKKEEETK